MNEISASFYSCHLSTLCNSCLKEEISFCARPFLTFLPSFGYSYVASLPSHASGTTRISAIIIDVWRQTVNPFASFFCIFVLVLGGPVVSHGGESHGGANKADIGVDEKLGASLPAGMTFRDEAGKTVRLPDAIDRPTIIAPVYLSCKHACPLLLMGLAEALGNLDSVTPGKDFQVIALSFDGQDTPKKASEKKKDYLKAIGRPFPPEAWRFLTGSKEQIETFTRSIGFRFQRSGMEFDHPVVLVVVGPGGKVSRYLYGSRFLPFDVTMAITEAEQGKIGISTRKLLSYCFSYDPLEKTYVFDILRVSGIVMLVLGLSFFGYLMSKTRRKTP